MEWVLWPVALFGGLLSIAAFVLWIWALVDCVQVPDDAMYESGNKLIWVLIIVFTSVIGAFLYLLIGRPRHRGGPAGPPPPGRGDRPPPGGTGLPPPPGAS